MQKTIAVLILAMAVAATASFAGPEDDLAQLDAAAQANQAAYLKLRNAVQNSGFSPDDLRKYLVQLDTEQKTFETDYLAYRTKLQAALAPQQAPQIVIAHDSSREEADVRFEAAQKAKREAEAQAKLAEQGTYRVVGHQAAQEDAARRSTQWQTQQAIDAAKREAEQAAQNAANAAWRRP